MATAVTTPFSTVATAVSLEDHFTPASKYLPTASNVKVWPTAVNSAPSIAISGLPFTVTSNLPTTSPNVALITTLPGATPVTLPD